MTINDGQLDHANREIASLRETQRQLTEGYVRVYDLLKEVASCGISQTLGRYHEVQIPVELWQQIREETDESEVEV